MKLANGIDKQLAVLNDFILQQTPIDKDYDPLKNALHLIHSAEGNINVKAIESSIQINHRTLEIHFKGNVGISPKAWPYRHLTQYEN